MKMGNVDGKYLRISWTTWGISSTFSGKMCYDNAKSYKKTGLHPLSRRYIFGETTEGSRIG